MAFKGTFDSADPCPPVSLQAPVVALKDQVSPPTEARSGKRQPPDPAAEGFPFSRAAGGWGSAAFSGPPSQPPPSAPSSLEIPAGSALR